MSRALLLLTPRHRGQAAGRSVAFGLKGRERRNRFFPMPPTGAEQAGLGGHVYVNVARWPRLSGGLDCRGKADSRSIAAG